MELRNPLIQQDIDAGRKLNLNLGSGEQSRANWYGVDLVPLPGVDIVADLNEPLDLLPDNSVAQIYSRHTMEHVREFLPLMRELHRVTCADGTIEIIVPHFSNSLGYSDPTHVRFFGLYSMYYFVDPADQPSKRKVPSFYADTRFRVHSVTIRFYNNNIVDAVLALTFGKLLNMHLKLQEVYERRLAWLYNAWEIRYVLSPVK